MGTSTASTGITVLNI